MYAELQELLGKAVLQDELLPSLRAIAVVEFYL